MTFWNNIATKSTFLQQKNPRRLSILDFFATVYQSINTTPLPRQKSSMKSRDMERIQV